MLVLASFKEDLASRMGLFFMEGLAVSHQQGSPRKRTEHREI